MTKTELIDQLISNHQHFTSYFSNLNHQDFTYSFKNEKWSAGQHAEHILRSVSPLKTVLSFPKWLLRLIFKKANRPSKTYGQLIEKYLQRLEKGGKASGRFIPNKVGASEKTVLRNKIESAVSKLCKSISKYSEEEMDILVLPHPLLGKITLREMLYFTIYHVEHHHKLAIRNLAAN